MQVEARQRVFHVDGEVGCTKDWAEQNLRHHSGRLCAFAANIHKADREAFPQTISHVANSL